MDAIETSPRKIVRASGIKRRDQILEAVLRIIVRNGVRGVRHRAIAREASVPLASTTYYFTDIEELLSEAFLFWYKRSKHHLDWAQKSVLQQLDDIDASGQFKEYVNDEGQLQGLAQHLSRVAWGYISKRINERRDDSLIQLAFDHEAVRSDKLHAVVVASHEERRQLMAAIFDYLDPKHAQEDAHILVSLLTRLEHEALMAGSEEKCDQAQRTICRYITSVIAIVHNHPQAKK